MWPDVRDSAWIGGDREGWERVPYWLDGAVPLAYLLGDEDLIARTKRYIDSILARQEADGWICPVAPEKRKKYDTWAILLISKVLLRYYECSGDERIPEALYRLMKNFAELLDAGEVCLRQWGKYRWFEGFPALNFLYARQPEEWMKTLALRLYRDGMDYRTVEKAWERPLNKWTLDTHIVNLCMMLKSEVLSADLLGKEELTGFAEREYSLLERFNGTAVGTFTGDECLSGTSPTQGTELCSVVELMDSMERLHGSARMGGKARNSRLQCPSRDSYGGHVGAPICADGKSDRLHSLPRALALPHERAGRAYLRAGASLRLLHREFRAGVSEARPLDLPALRRRDSQLCSASLGGHDGIPRCTGEGHARYRISLPQFLPLFGDGGSKDRYGTVRQGAVICPPTYGERKASPCA